MEPIAFHQKHLNNLPPELMDKIFEHSNATDLAQSRTVCVYWRNIVESLYMIRLEMNSANAEVFVKKSTATKIHLKVISVPDGVSELVEFSDFMSRVNILELTGNTTKNNVINILNGCRILKFLTVDRLTVRDEPHAVLESTAKDSFLHLKEFNIRSFQNFAALRALTDPLGVALKQNCLTKININSAFQVKNILRLLFVGVFGETKPNENDSMAVQGVFKKALQSLEFVAFDYGYGRVTAGSTIFVKLHPNTGEGGANSTNPIYHPQIFELRLGRVLFRPQVNTTLLKLFETQFRMKNLDVLYSNQGELEQILSTINKNCEALEEIHIESTEPQEDTFRVLNCSSVEKCLKLRELLLSSQHRKVKLLHILSLPASLQKLFLDGFVPTGSSEMFGVFRMALYPYLTELSLATLPWFIQDEIQVEIFEVMQLRWLLNVFHQLRRVWLLDKALHGNPATVSTDFVTWCRAGGGENITINEIHTSYQHFLGPNNRIHVGTVYDIRIGLNQP